MDIAKSRRLLALFAAVLCFELVLVAATYQLYLDLECEAVGRPVGCRALRSLVARALAVIAAFLIYTWARPHTWRALISVSAPRHDPRPWLALHVFGVGLILAPIVLSDARDPVGFFSTAIGFWLLGGLAASIGALSAIATPSAWIGWIQTEEYRPLAVAAVALAIPDLAELAWPLWDSSLLTEATFKAVALLLEAVGQSPLVDQSAHIIGIDPFYVHVARQCSGVEGFALISAFTFLYALLLRGQLKVARFLGSVLPIALALSWGLNVLRIAILIVIGAHASPDLAVNGFHSYSGWLFFTLLAVSLLGAARSVPWLWSGSIRPASPRSLDRVSALVLPFIVFMIANVVLNTFVSIPDLLYPVKVIAVALAVAMCLPIFRGLDWTISLVAVVAGITVGLLWLITAPPRSGADVQLEAALAGAGTASFAIWAVFRIFGSILLFPLVEEAFFRGYMLSRLDLGGPWGRWLGIVLSTLAFALLHGRWLEAGAAGFVFAWLRLRKDRLSDPIVGHCAANATIASYAAANGDWTLI